MALTHRPRTLDETVAVRPTDAAALTVGDDARRRATGRNLRPVPAVDAGPRTGRPALPPSVARVAARTRLSAELLAAMLEIDDRRRATLDDIEHADALAARLLARRAERQRATPGRAGVRLAG